MIRESEERMVKLTPRKMQGSRIILHYLKDSTNHTLSMADNTEVKIVGVLNNALIRRPFLKTSKALIYVANDSVVLESNGEKIELNMNDKVIIPEANAIDYVAYYLEQIGVDNLEKMLDGMVAEM
ncbi:Myosin-10, partial [Bienertia sinuspersici]